MAQSCKVPAANRLNHRCFSASKVKSVQARRLVPVRVAAPDAPASTKTWTALVASAEFFLRDPQNEAMAEQFRERIRFLEEGGKKADFYLIPNPKWLDSNFPSEAKKVKRPCVAIVSTDELWVNFMKLRLDRVLPLDLSKLSEEEILALGEPLGDIAPPEKWTAPYAPYTSGWWEKFYPQ